MIIPTVFHEDVFYAYFEPFRHPASRFNIWGGHGLETFGEDLQTAQSFDPNHIWTVLDGASGSAQWITPGLHRVNRVCFLVTRLPHHDAAIEFRCENRPYPITPRGLARRITTLTHILQTHRATLHSAD
jgi:hypothetical protein